MGYNSTVVINNDFLDKIQKDQSFGDTLVRAIHQAALGSPTPVGHYGTAVESHHSDANLLISVCNVTGEVVGGFVHSRDLDGCEDDRARKIKMLRALAIELGYRITKVLPKGK